MKKLILIATILITTKLLCSQIINIPADYPSIQQGINSADDGDTVLVQPGTYVENIQILGKNITLASLMLTTQDTSYIAQTIIDGNQYGSVVKIDEVDSNMVLCGFTITNGDAYWANGSPEGGGININSASPKLIWLDVHSNDAWDAFFFDYVGWGGGIFCKDGGFILRHSKVRNNYSIEGGGIYINDHSSAGIYCSDVVISNNHALFGGGLEISSYDTLANNNPFTLSSVVIKDNEAYEIPEEGGGYGGGIFIQGKIVGTTWINVWIKNNTSKRGGGISMANVTFYSLFERLLKPGILYNVHIDSNYAQLQGGGIYIDKNSGLSIYPWCEDNLCSSFNNISISENNAGYGGGIYSEGNLIINGSDSLNSDIRIIGNTGSGGGGGIFCKYTLNGGDKFSLRSIKVMENMSFSNGGGIYMLDRDFDFVNMLISGNTANQKGGGIYRNKGLGTIYNSTFSGNYAAHQGGAICSWGNQSTDMELKNCILWNDQPDEILDMDSSFKVSATYSNIQGGWDGSGNMDVDPLFTGIGDSPFQLLTASPCIDFGSPDTTGLNLPLSDIIGNKRIWDGDNNGTNIIDMGAYEYGLLPVSVEEKVITENNVKIFPNPANDEIFIANDKGVLITEINIFNQMGQKVIHEINPGNPLNISTLKQGIYFMEIISNESTVLEKLIVR